ncbi:MULTISPECIES: hypothetical protein [unclassified Nostoc]|uniref:hypothetical protein n=1 Tax=unclassified Nostoc TaxID=2593658 RepID=UPI001D66FFC1|nr:hypothetical protein [Nostoc sp. JL34]MBN3885886.1 hypothetical protein [Nostoc sp. JL34]
MGAGGLGYRGLDVTKKFFKHPLRVKLELSNVRVVEDFPVGWLCDRQKNEFNLV